MTVPAALPPSRRRRRPTVRIRTRLQLIGLALAVQAVVLAAGWWTTFSLVRGAFAATIEERVVAQNAELAERVADLLPALPEAITFGGADWERAQRVIEGLDDLPAGGFACLLDGDGRILCHPDIRRDPGLLGLDLSGETIRTASGGAARRPASRPGNGLGVAANAAPEAAEAVALRDLGREPVSGRIRFAPGNTHYVATRALGDSPYRLLVHQPVASLVDAGETSTRLVLATAACALLLVLGLTGGGLAWLVRGYEGRIEVINRRLQGEIDIAHDIQQGTLPTELPPLPGLDLAGFSAAAEETGGDTWDVVPLGRTADAGGPPDERVLLLVADATGHGVGPALSVTQLRAMLRIAARSGDGLERIASLVNAQLHADLPGSRFITAWLGTLDPATATLEVLSAGQGPVLRYVAARGDVVQEPADTWPLGVMPTLGQVPSRRIDLAPGDVLLVPTDGLIEARDAAGEAFGADRLAAALAAGVAAGESAAMLLDRIRDAVARHAPGRWDDDRTAMILRRPRG